MQGRNLRCTIGERTPLGARQTMGSPHSTRQVLLRASVRPCNDAARVGQVRRILYDAHALVRHCYTSTVFRSTSSSTIKYHPPDASAPFAESISQYDHTTWISSGSMLFVLEPRRQELRNSLTTWRYSTPPAEIQCSSTLWTSVDEND